MLCLNEYKLQFLTVKSFGQFKETFHVFSFDFQIYSRYGIFDTSTAERECPIKYLFDLMQFPISFSLVLRKDRLSNFGTQTANGYFDPIWDFIDMKNVEKAYSTGYDNKYYYMSAYGANNFDGK